MHVRLAPITLVVLAILVVACQPQPDEFVVGASLALTGFGATWGENIQNGLELAREEINANGGINDRPVRIIYEDFASSDLKKAVGAAQKFASVDGVDVIMTQWAEDTEVAIPIAIENNLLLMNIASGAADIPQRGENVFMIIPSDHDVWGAVIDYLDENGLERGVVFQDQSAYFESSLITFQELWGERPELEVHRLSDDDVRSLLAQSGTADFLFLNVNIGTAGRIKKVAHEMGLDTVFIGTKGMAVPEYFETAGSAADGLILPEFERSSAEFIEKYSARYGKEPGIAADYAYDALMVLAQAGGATTEELRNNLLGISGLEGASGTITFTPAGQRIGKTVHIMEVIDGRAVISVQGEEN